MTFEDAAHTPKNRLHFSLRYLAVYPLKGVDSLEVAVVVEGEIAASAGLTRMAHNYVIQDFDIQEFPGPNEIVGYFDVCVRRSSFATRVIVHQHYCGSAGSDCRSEYLSGVHKHCIYRPDGDKLMTLDMALRVENEHGQALALGVEVGICGDVEPPVFGCLRWLVAQAQAFGNWTLAQGYDFEFFGDVAICPIVRQFSGQRHRPALMDFCL